MTRIFVESALAVGETVALSDGAAHHLVGVLRKRAGETVTLFNGRGGEYAGVIETLDRRNATVKVLDHSAVERESPLAVTLAQGISRGDRMDFSVQKAVELGVRRIVPFLAARTTVNLTGDRAARRLAHWHGIIVHACEQSGRNRLPELGPIRSLEELLVEENFTTGIVLNPEGAGALPTLALEHGPVLLVIGPEGGLDTMELARLDDAGFFNLRLGPRILRTETATAVSLGVLQSHFGDL